MNWVGQFPLENGMNLLQLMLIQNSSNVIFHLKILKCKIALVININIKTISPYLPLMKHKLAKHCRYFQAQSSIIERKEPEHYDMILEQMQLKILTRSDSIVNGTISINNYLFQLNLDCQCNHS